MARRRANTVRGRWVIDQLALASGSRVLEVGYGPGAVLDDVCRRTANGHVVGIDISPVMMRQAAHRNRSHAQAGLLELRIGDAAHLAPDLRDFDVIFGINVWQYWQDPATVIKDLGTRLRPGGRLALAYMRPPGCRLTHGQAATQLTTQFTAATFTHIATEWMQHKPPAVLVSGQRPATTVCDTASSTPNSKAVPPLPDPM
ncbi:class I SAM-dependent methyltransferase [Nocardia otitidiscaviarum]|nr:class I SAM-dependent methyltransferase [Nocardia otitidiscaviarum]